MFIPILASIAGLTAVAIQMQTLSITRLVTKNRHAVMSSREPCPSLIQSETCRFEIFARNANRWQACDQNHAPSGADLPMRRWFLIEGSCRYGWGQFEYKLTLPAQKILR